MARWPRYYVAACVAACMYERQVYDNGSEPQTRVNVIASTVQKGRKYITVINIHLLNLSINQSINPSIHRLID